MVRIRLLLWAPTFITTFLSSNGFQIMQLIHIPTFNHHHTYYTYNYVFKIIIINNIANQTNMME